MDVIKTVCDEIFFFRAMAFQTLNLYGLHMWLTRIARAVSDVYEKLHRGAIRVPCYLISKVAFRLNCAIDMCDETFDLHLMILKERWLSNLNIYSMRKQYSFRRHTIDSMSLLVMKNTFDCQIMFVLSKCVRVRGMTTERNCVRVGCCT